ncbi:hypothetical protein TSACC_2315 [Terrimicrobium sacchariphilum]|uniref:HEAT repeat-containing protein n=2 Tax=Terrimicrobium sacchariphilum TaxID=690879 RepID=A0A146G2P0_TERSA|nr:hypothetical protein TSACC_2315 [Terrimicrobium sacchariphilum]
MRNISILIFLIVFSTIAANHGRSFQTQTGKWMWDNSDVVCVARWKKWTARESAPGKTVFLVEYCELQSLKGAERFPKTGTIILTMPDMTERIPSGFSREFPDNLATLLFLKNESGLLQPPPDGDWQFCPVFEYKDPLPQFHSLKELLICAANTQPDNCYAFFDLMTGFEDQELRDFLVAKSQSSDLRTAYFALSTLSSDKDPDAYELAEAALERGQDTMSPDLRKSFEHLIENTEHFAKQPPL